MTDREPVSASPPERLTTINETAEILGLPPWKIARAVKARLVPSYRFLNGRILLRVSEVEAAINATKQGGLAGSSTESDAAHQSSPRPPAPTEASAPCPDREAQLLLPFEEE